MISDDHLGAIVNVILPTATAFAGALLAAVSIGPGKLRQKIGWITLFLFLTVAAILLGMEQQRRAASQQTKIEQKNSEIRNKADLDTGFMKGELYFIQQTLLQVAENSDPKNALVLIKAMRSSSNPAPSTRPALPPPAAPVESSPTNHQLAEIAKTLAQQFRDLQDQFNRDYRSQQIANRSPVLPPDFFPREIERMQNVRIQAVALRGLISKRLPTQPRDAIVEMVLDQNFIAGANPLNEVADYFDRFAVQLENQESPTSK